MHETETADDFQTLVNTALPTLVREAAISESGKLYRSVMARVERPLLRQALDLAEAGSAVPHAGREGLLRRIHARTSSASCARRSVVTTSRTVKIETTTTSALGCGTLSR